LKTVDTSAISALLDMLALNAPLSTSKPYTGWIAGPVIGSIVGAALVGYAGWFLYRRRQRANGQLAHGPAMFSDAETDAAASIRRVGAKYAAQQAAEPGAPQVRTKFIVCREQHGFMASRLRIVKR
jgi:hypothetical protein